MAKTTVPVVEDEGMLALHRVILVLFVSATSVAPGPMVAPAQAAEESVDTVELTESDSGSEGPHHRIDLGIDRFGNEDRSITTLSLGYTWAPGLQHSLNINILDSDLPVAEISTGQQLSSEVTTLAEYLKALG